MKIKLFIFLVFIACANFGFGQHPALNNNPKYIIPNDSLNYGLRASFNLCDFNRHNFSKVQPCFSFGIWLQKPLSKRLSLKGELLFCKKGFALIGNYPVIGINTIRFKLYYLNFNFLMRYRVLSKIDVFGGIGIDRLLFYHAKFADPFPDTVTSVSDIAYNNPNRMPTSFTIGASYKINKQIAIDFRYRRTLGSITDNSSFRCYFMAVGVDYEFNLEEL